MGGVIKKEVTHIPETKKETRLKGTKAASQTAGGKETTSLARVFGKGGREKV